MGSWHRALSSRSETDTATAATPTPLDRSIGGSFSSESSSSSRYPRRSKPVITWDTIIELQEDDLVSGSPEDVPENSETAEPEPPSDRSSLDVSYRENLL